MAPHSLPTGGEPMPPAVPLDELMVQLLDALDHDLDLLTTLQYRLIVLVSLTAADQSPALPTAVKEVELAHESLRHADLVRAALSAQVAAALDLEPTDSLEAIASRLPNAWAELLIERRRAITELIRAVQGFSASAQGAMARRAALANEALNFLRGEEGAATYNTTPTRSGLLIEGTL